MNWFDYTILAIILLSVILSLFRGLIREVMSLLIWLGAFWLAWRYVDRGAEMLSGVVDLPSARHLIAFVALFLAALIVGGLLNFFIGKLIQSTGLSATDRFLGMFFGAFRGMVAVIALAFFISATPFSKDPWWQQSRLAPYFADMAEWVRSKLPEDLASYFSFDKMQSLELDLQPASPQNTPAEPNGQPTDNG